MNQRFSIIPARAIEDDRLTKGDLKVLNALGVYADSETGWSYPSQQTLAEKINMTRMSVSRSIKKLSECGYIDSMNNFRENGSQSSNKYRVLFDFPSINNNGYSSGCNTDVTGSGTTEMLHQKPPYNKNVTPENVTPPEASKIAYNKNVTPEDVGLLGCNIHVTGGVTSNVTPITTQDELIDDYDCSAGATNSKNQKTEVKEIYGWLEKLFNTAIPLPIAPVYAWQEWGADFEKDIKPVAERYKAKHPDKPPRSLTFLDEPIQNSITQRNKPMPEISHEKSIGHHQHSGLQKIDGIAPSRTTSEVDRLIAKKLADHEQTQRFN